MAHGVVARLRASKADFVEAEVANARRCGRRWAEHRAEYDELRRIEGVRESFTSRHVEHEYDTDLEAAQALHEAITLGKDPGHDALSKFFLVKADSVDDIGSEFIVEFLEGAMEVWSEVKPFV